MLCEHLSRELFDFTECDGLETACAFKTKAETAYAAEKV